MATEIRVPTLGESVSEAEVGEWLKKPGDSVSEGETLVTLETDKVALDVPAPASGTMGDIVADVGEMVGVDALLASMEAGSGSGAGASAAAAAPAKSSAPATQANPGSAKIEPPAKADSKDEGGGIVDIVVPQAGESVTEAEVGAWFKKVGDAVSVDEPLVELETDKAAQDVIAQDAGTIEEIVAQTGETVEVGAVLARVRVGGSAASAQSPASTDAPGEQGYGGANPGSGAGASEPGGSKPNGAVETGSATQGASYAPGSVPGEMPPSPAAARMMAEKGLSSGDVQGSGRRGQVLKGDVIAALESGATAKSKDAKPSKPAARAPSSEADAPREERVRMSRLRQTIARRLKDAQDTAAMLTTFNEVDMGAVMDLRKSYKEVFEKKHGVKLGFMGFFTKAVCHALKEIPAVNAEIDGTDIVYKNFCHIGVAVGTDKGLVVPVVRDADAMTIAEIEKEIGRLGRAARDGELGLSDMQGGTFTISNGGVYGSLMSTPILNAPQSGILGMHKIQERPMAVGGEVVVRPMMYLALSYDHRIVDGKEAVTFLVRVKESLEDPQRLVLDL